MRIVPGPLRVALTAALLATVGASVSFAQSRRAPNADEAKVLTRFYAALDAITGGFADENWKVSGGTLRDDPTNESISMHAGVPLDDCLGGDRTWTVPQGSPLFDAKLKPLYDRLAAVADTLVSKMKAGQDAAADKQEVDRLRAQIKNANAVTMDVCVNSPNVDAAALAPGTPSLVTGVVAHKVKADVCGQDAGSCYVLVYGDWKTARLSGGRDTFHFVHPPASPYLENIVIRLYGADDRIQQMLKADWLRLNAALGGPAT